MIKYKPVTIEHMVFKVPSSLPKNLLNGKFRPYEPGDAYITCYYNGVIKAIKSQLVFRQFRLINIITDV